MVNKKGHSMPAADLFLQYHKKNPQEVLAQLQTSAERGLTDEQVKERQHQFGLNKLEEKEVTWYAILLRQARSPLLYLFVLIALLSFIVDEKNNALEYKYWCQMKQFFEDLATTDALLS